MKTERRSGSTRTLQPIQMLRETRYMSRDEILRELRTQGGTMPRATCSPSRGQQRCGGGD
jgi:hypothetical protein